MTHLASSIVGLSKPIRVVASCTLLLSSVLWLGSLVSMAVTRDQLQYGKAILELLSVGSLISALARIVILSSFPEKMRWPFSSARNTFFISAVYFVFTVVELWRELNGEGNAMTSFWIEAPHYGLGP